MDISLQVRVHGLIVLFEWLQSTCYHRYIQMYLTIALVVIT
jgi:hypothetical protein